MIANGTQEERNDAALKLTEFEVSAPARTGLLHGDPHPGNFMIAPDGRLVALDFGAVAEYPGGIPPAVGKILRLARDEDYEALFPLLRSRGSSAAARHHARGDPQLPRAVRRPAAVGELPLHPQVADEGRVHRDRRARRAVPDGPQARAAAQYVMLFRVLLGMVGICSQMEADAPYRAIVEHWIPLLDGDD